METIAPPSSPGQTQNSPASWPATSAPAAWADGVLENILRRPRMPPGWLMQMALRIYLETEHWWDVLRGAPSTLPADASDEAAEQSHELMRVHYDLALPLFAKMLGPSMKYSMALWSRGVHTLEGAQAAMLADACRKAGVRDGDCVLDLGCGFGSLAEYLLRTYPKVQVTGLTLSQTQASYIRHAQRWPGHPLNTPRFRLVQDDFNHVEFDGEFDRVLSLGVFEHVSNLTVALEKIRNFVRPGGQVFLHYIVYRPVRAGQCAARQNHFIQQHIFPGGRVYAFEELTRHQKNFVLQQSWYLSGRNYQKTLHCWLRNFLRARTAIAQATPMSERRLRLWEIYLRACAATFACAGGRAFGNGQYLLTAR